VVTISRLSNGQLAITLGKPGPFITISRLTLDQLLRAARDSGLYEPFPVRPASRGR
jgi:hypothetical protein